VNAARELLEQGFTELGLAGSDSEAQRDALLRLARLLEEWGARVNLSGYRSLDQIVRRLILDAVALSHVLPDAQSIADLGSGAGFPGLPLAILRPGSSVTLIETRERRHYFQRAAIRTLGLGNLRAVRGRSQDLPPTAHEGVVAQALARPSRALALMLPWAAPGGWLAIPSAATAPVIDPVAGVNILETLRYSVPCGGPERSVWIAARSLQL
jgi:16S rRNA (guanine527-N7)-methyltransferase